MLKNSGVLNLSKDETFGAPCKNPYYHRVWRPHEGHQTKPRYFPAVQTNRRTTTHTEDTCSAERQKPARKQAWNRARTLNCLVVIGQEPCGKGLIYILQCKSKYCSRKKDQEMKNRQQIWSDISVSLLGFLWRKCNQRRWSSRARGIITTGDNSVQSFSGIPEGKLSLSIPACM